MLVAGGLDDNDQKTNNCFLYNTSSKTFKKFASLNVKRYGHVLVNFNGVVYSIGGKNEKYEGVSCQQGANRPDQVHEQQ